MKDFYELMSQVEEKNRQKRMMLAQAAQPFFDALYQKRVYDETYQKKLKEQEDANARYSQSLAEYEKTGVVPATADPALHNLAFSRRTAEQDRKAGIRNELEAMGFGDQIKEIESKYPNVDPDVLKGMIMEKADVKAIDKKAKTFGTKYYGVYQDALARTNDPFLAFGDMNQRVMADEEAKAAARAAASGKGKGKEDGEDATFGQTKDAYIDLNTAYQNVMRFDSGVVYSTKTNPIVVTVKQITIDGNKVTASRNGDLAWDGKSFYRWDPKKKKWKKTTLDKEDSATGSYMRAGYTDYISAREKYRTLKRSEAFEFSGKNSTAVSRRPVTIEGVTWP